MGIIFQSTIIRDIQSGDAQTRRMMIGMQENFLLNALYTLRDSALDVRHVGACSYSRLSVSDLVAEFLPQETETLNGKNWNVSVVAEITTNHFGDRGRLERMVRAARAVT